MEADPGKIDNLFLAAEIKEKTGDWQKAVEYYERAATAPSVLNSYALDSEGLKARALVRLGTLCKGNGQEEHAAKYFRQCLGKYPQVINCYYALGDLLTEKGKYAEAEALFRRAINLRRGDPKGYVGLAKTLACSGRLPETLEEAKKILARIRQKEKSPLL